MKRLLWCCCWSLLILQMCVGCSLTEIRGKTKFGVENRYAGSSRTTSQRWLVQQGFNLTWRDEENQKFTTGVSYRRRDTDDGGGDHDDGVWFDFSFPIWKKSQDPVARRIDILERRLAHLEAERKSILRQESAVAQNARETVNGAGEFPGLLPASQPVGPLDIASTATK